MTNFKKNIIKKAIENEYAKLHGTFKLFVEDEAPEDVNYAGKSSNRQEVSFEDLPESIRAQLNGTALLGNDMMGCTCPIETIDPNVPEEYQDYVCDSIYIFVNAIINIGKVTGLRRIIKEVVRHEYRHSQQFIWCRENGVSVLEALVKENQFEYGEGILESDAVAFQKGEVNDLNEVMKSFI